MRKKISIILKDLRCIAVAHNKSAEGLKLATSERIERVKQVMEVDAEPSWFNAT